MRLVSDQVAEALELTLAQVHAALTYFESIEEIRDHMRQAEELYEEMKPLRDARLSGKHTETSEVRELKFLRPS